MSPGGWVRVTRVSAGATSHVDSNRDLSQAHQYRVVAINNDLASLPTLSTALQLAAAAAGDSTGTGWTSPAGTGGVSCSPAAAPYVRCVHRVAWEGPLRSQAFATATCPAGAELVTGGYSGRLYGVIVQGSMPIVGADRQAWTVELQPDPAASDAAANTRGKHVDAVAVCRTR